MGRSTDGAGFGTTKALSSDGCERRRLVSRSGIVTFRANRAGMHHGGPLDAEAVERG